MYAEPVPPTSVRPSPDGDVLPVDEVVEVDELLGDLDLVGDLGLAEVVVDLEEEVVAAVARAAAVDGAVDDVLGGGEVGAPVQLEAVVDLLRVGAAVDVDEERVLFPLVKVVRQVEPHLGLEVISCACFDWTGNSAAHRQNHLQSKQPPVIIKFTQPPLLSLLFGDPLFPPVQASYMEAPGPQGNKLFSHR